MTIRRRTFLGTCAVAAGLTCSLAVSQTPAGAWPAKPVKFIVPFAPGGGADAAIRMLADQLRMDWGTSQPVVIDNKTGGNTIIAVNTLLGLPRDGYSFLVTINSTLLLPHLGQKLPFDPVVDLVPVGAITQEQLVLVANPELGAKNFDALIEKARTNPKATGFGTLGAGSLAHLLASQIALERKVDLVVAHFRGAAPAVQGVFTGEVAMALSNPGTVQQHIAAGKLTPMAVTGASRSRFFPEVPTFKELGITGMDRPAWIGVFAAKGTPTEIVQKLGADMRRALQNPELVHKLNNFGQEPGTSSVEEFQRTVKADDELLGAMIRTHRIRLE